MIHLLWCPHCENESVIRCLESHEMEDTYYFKCKYCDMRGPSYYDDDLAKAAWLSISMKTQDQLEDEI
jgi:transcription elongation factor Elf1